jgi:hypothetical protein
VTTDTAIEHTGVQSIFSEQGPVLVDFPGVGIVYNELPKVATELGMDIADLGWVLYVSFKTIDCGRQPAAYESLALPLSYIV